MQGISGEVQWLKKPMLAYGNNMCKNNQFSVLCPEVIKNVKNYPEKNLPKIKKCLPRKENLPNTCSPAILYHLIQVTHFVREMSQTEGLMFQSDQM